MSSTTKPWNAPGLKRQLRVGLQAKAVLVLTCVVVSLMLAGGWFYYLAAQTSLRHSDAQQADRLAGALTLASQDALAARHLPLLKQLVDQCARNENVRYVALIDAAGRTLAEASSQAAIPRWEQLQQTPVSILRVTQLDENVLILTRPITANAPGEGAQGPEILAGALRLAVDTSSTTEILAGVLRRMSIVGAGIVLAAIPLGYLLVWRVLVQPVRRLHAVTRQLAWGDFDTRANLGRNDEIGELGAAFDSMADVVAAMRKKLVLANERLERKVAARTAELQLANRRLREEIAEKEDFLRAVSHDLNAPLRNIAGMTSMVLLRFKGVLPEEVSSRLQRVQANVDAGSELIGELLELSRVTLRPQKPDAVDIGKLMDDLASAFEYELKARGIALEIAKPMPCLFVEKNRIRQVFQNLIDNAIKYMDRPTGGRIAIRHDLAGDMHEFRVSDNGPGIAPADQQKVFCVFRRGENSMTARVPGKGVGLALVRTIVGKYGGQVRLESVQGQGATFIVALPVQGTQLPVKTSEAPGVENANETVYHSIGG